jgi:CubicO group peptidase (beta-lactamase class C family)
MASLHPRTWVISILTVRISTDGIPEFFAGLEIMYPSYAPWQTATYSNVAYQLLAYALENISGKKFIDILNDRVIKPLGLNRTYYENAPDNVGIIPGTVKDTYWSVSLGEASP